MNSIRQRICDLFCQHEEPETPFTLRHRSGQHLRQKLQVQFPAANIRIADMNYSAPTRGEFDAWLQEDNVSTRTYHPEWFDCDDFARAIRCKMFKIGQNCKTTLTIAYCEGQTVGGYHAFNMLLDDKDSIYIVEPQNDHVVPADESSYKPDFIQV